MKIPGYPFTIHKLTSEDGGDFLVELPDLPGCMSNVGFPLQTSASIE